MSRCIYNVILIASALIFCLATFAEEQKAKVSISDPECRFFGLSKEDISHFSSNQKLLFYEAFKMISKGNLAKAAEKFKELSGQVKNFEVEYNLGLIYAKQGDLQEAEASLIESIKMYSKQREAWKILWKVQEALGKPEAQSTKLRFLEI
jgi:tetratricopeptide (TPR) repeat protein